MRTPIPLLLALVLAAAPAFAQAPEPAPETPLAWASVDSVEQRFVTKLLESPHWPFRVFALFRLERYEGEAVDEFVRARLADEVWQVRCFALRAAHLRGVEVDPALLEKEADGRVIRTALRYGVKLDEVRIARGARTLMRTRSLDELILGLEIAAESDVAPLKKEGARRARRLIRNMDDSVCVRVSPRLARILGVSTPPETAAAWRAWLDGHDDALVLVSPPTELHEMVRDPALVSNMDVETFSRLIDYLDGLRQRDIEIAVVIDVTASMIPMIDEAKAGVESLILFLNDISRTMRIAIIAYRDHDHAHVWEGQAFTDDVAKVRTFLMNLQISGGADLPEAVLDGMQACGELKWHEEAARQIILVGDARPHDDDEYPLANLLAEITDAGVVVNVAHVPMRANPSYLRAMSPEQATAYQREIVDHNERTEFAFAEIARLGGGSKVTLDEAEALVPSIMHMTLEEGWWPTFDAFYALYLELCR
jgi:Mg-chelatase subunit ChlD